MMSGEEKDCLILVILFQWFHLSHVQLLWPHGLELARLLCPWDFLGKNIGKVSQSVMSDSLWPHGFSPPSSSVHGILEWVANSFSRGSSQLRAQTFVSCIAGVLLHSRWILYQPSHQGKLFRSKKIFAKIPSPDSLSWLISLDLITCPRPDQHWKEWHDNGDLKMITHSGCPGAAAMTATQSVL